MNDRVRHSIVLLCLLSASTWLTTSCLSTNVGNPQDEDASPIRDTLDTSDWKAILTPVEFAILRESATERPGTGRYLDQTAPGAYHCAGCGRKLYDAQHKFHSGCGWPSFFQPSDGEKIREARDTSHGMIRTEVMCDNCGAHLGHVFEDGPQPTGLRYCINSASINLEKE